MGTWSTVVPRVPVTTRRAGQNVPVKHLAPSSGHIAPSRRRWLAGAGASLVINENLIPGPGANGGAGRRPPRFCSAARRQHRRAGGGSFRATHSPFRSDDDDSSA